MKKILNLAVALVLLVGVTAGCKKETPPPKKPAQTVKPQPAPTPPPQPAVPPEQPAEGEQKVEAPPVYTYDPIRPDGKPKQSPFKPMDVWVGPEVQYEISQMGVVGVILHGRKRAALQTPNCMTTYMNVGDKIGIHDGKVVDISLEGVLVRESFMDMNGRIQEYERLIPNRPYEYCR